MSAFASVADILNLLLRHGQSPLVYPAAFESYQMRRPLFIQNPAMYGMQYMAPLLRTADGVDLSCYLIPQTRTSLASTYKVPKHPIPDERVELTSAATDARATVIVFHGNSMHNWEDMNSARYLHGMKFANITSTQSRYSFSGGSPTESGLQIDAQAALNYVLAQPHLAQVPIVLYGHSLGGGVAIDLASRNPSLVSAVVVSNTFTSVPDIVRTWPIIGNFSFICSQKWRSIDKLRFIPIDTPILMISGRQDEVIPAQLMDRLWQAAQIRGMPKSSFHWPSMPCGPQTLDIEPPPEVVPKNDVFYSLEMGTHNSTPTHTKYWRAIRKFVEKVDKRRQNPEPVYEDIAERALIRRWRYQEGNFEILEDS